MDMDMNIHIIHDTTTYVNNKVEQYHGKRMNVFAAYSSTETVFFGDYKPRMASRCLSGFVPIEKRGAE